MATDEVACVRDPEILKKRVEFWASTMDAFLQDFLDKAMGNDKLGTIVACARLAQLGHAVAQEYKANFGNLCDSETELKVAQQACNQTVDMVNRNGEQCGLLKEGAQVAPAGDKSQN